jgi:D-glutamate cyclase
VTPDDTLTAIRDVIQEDVGGRGLRTDPHDNLVTATANDFVAACRSIAGTPGAAVAVVTGFIIPTADPPAGETDGPLGAVFLARALAPLGIPVVLLSDPFAVPALAAGLTACRLRDMVPVEEIPEQVNPARMLRGLPVTHLIALERVGPSHTPASVRPEEAETFVREVPAEHHDRCHTMRGRDITDLMRPAHRLFEVPAPGRPVTIGIGDGGNEIGMGKLPWDTIRRNVPGGDVVACRVPTDHLIVAGVSNWGAYALAAGVQFLRGAAFDGELFDVDREGELLRVMVEQGPLVDGVTGRREAGVDGLPFEQYAEKMFEIGEFLCWRECREGRHG